MEWKKMKTRNILGMVILCALFLSGCQSAADVAESVNTDIDVEESTSVISTDNAIEETTGASEVVEEVVTEGEATDVVDDYAKETTAIAEVEAVHDWENINYAEHGDIVESGFDLGEEIPFADYFRSVVDNNEEVVSYFEDNSETFAEFMQTSTSYYAYVGRINGDFDNDGEQEYLVATNYGRGYRNNIAIVDNGEVVYWGTADNGADAFSRVRVGQYYKDDPEYLANGVVEDYYKYTYIDNNVSAENVFIGLLSSAREAYNYYYQIVYDDNGYTINNIRKAGWETNNGEDENGNIIGRQFIDEVY